MLGEVKVVFFCYSDVVVFYLCFFGVKIPYTQKKSKFFSPAKGRDRASNLSAHIGVKRKGEPRPRSMPTQLYNL